MTDKTSPSGGRAGIDSKWSTPPLKAAWFDDDERAENELKVTTTPPMQAAEQMTVQDFFDLFAPDEPASG